MFIEKENFLTPLELSVITGFKRKSKQVNQLKKMGIPFEVDGFGLPLVLRRTVLKELENPMQKVTAV